MSCKYNKISKCEISLINEYLVSIQLKLIIILQSLFQNTQTILIEIFCLKFKHKIVLSIKNILYSNFKLIKVTQNDYEK